MTDGANFPGEAFGKTITFNCRLDTGADKSLVSCLSQTNSRDWFKFATSDLMAE